MLGDPGATSNRRRDNPFADAKKRVGLAILHLLSPATPFERRLAQAMQELARGFDAAVASPEALELYQAIVRIAGDGDWEARAAALAEAQRTTLVTAFWSLDRVLARDYFAWRADSTPREPG